MVVFAIVATVMCVVLMTAMTVDFGFKNKPNQARTIVVMMRFYGMQQNNRAGQYDHYFCSQMLHCMTFTGDITVVSNAVSLCKNT